MRQDRRSHIEDTVRRFELDMTCQTEERGSPKTLVCTKNQASYERQCARREKDIAWMKDIVGLIEEKASEITSMNERMRAAMSR